MLLGEKWPQTNICLILFENGIVWEVLVLCVRQEINSLFCLFIFNYLILWYYKIGNKRGENALIMQVKELLQNGYGQYLSQYEKKYLEKYGRLHNLETVKKQLEKYFKNVSIRGRGKKAVVYVGKPKPIKGDDLKTALVSQIVRELDPYGRSLSYWCGKTGLALVPYEINDKAIKELPDQDQALARYFIRYARTRQRNYFESAYRQAVKMVGGTWQYWQPGR